MRRAILLLASAALCWISVSSHTTAETGQSAETKPGQQPESARVQERLISYDPALKIVNQILDSDAALIVARHEIATTAAPPIGVSWAAFKSSLATAVAVVHVTNVKGELTEDGAWIDSEITGSVVTVFKSSPALPLSEGHDLSFRTSGGQLMIGGTSVRAVMLGTKSIPHRAGARYLQFLYLDRSGRLETTPESSYLIDGQELVNLGGELSLIDPIGVEFERLGGSGMKQQ